VNLGDFSSIVQLGVGLHAGTALMQSVAEFASTPVSRRLSRLAKIAEIRSKKDASREALHEIAQDLLSDLEVKKVQFFNEYREVVAVNTVVAMVLSFILILTGFLYSEQIPGWAAVLIVLVSFAPATASLAFLWFRWRNHTKALTTAIDALDAALLG
jgi:hypothetical protein